MAILALVGAFSEEFYLPGHFSKEQSALSVLLPVSSLPCLDRFPKPVLHLCVNPILAE